MLNKNDVVWWSEIECDLYEEDGYTFGVVFDIITNHRFYYLKTDVNNQEVYRSLGDDVYKAIDLFNAELKKTIDT